MIKCGKGKTIFNECYRSQRKTFCDMGDVHVCNIRISCILMVKNYSDNWHSIKNTGKDLTLKQMFDISAKLVSEQDEISGLETIDWENSSWKYLSLIGDEQVISPQRIILRIFRFCIVS